MARKYMGARVVVALLVAFVAAMGFALPTTPAAAVDASSLSTDIIADLTRLVTQALPFITAAIGLGVVLSWLRRLFRG